MLRTYKTSLLTLAVLFFVTAVNGQNMVFTSIDGNRIDVGAQKGKVVVMAIGASWLPISDDQAETINKLAKKYSGRDDVIFYFIATDSSSPKDKSFASNADLKKFGSRNKLAVSILRDASGARSVERFNIDQLPAFIILDKQGRPSGDPISGSDPFGKTDTSALIARRVDRLL